MADDDVATAATVDPRTRRRRVVAWALWDWGSAAFNAVITTFVFTRWLTSSSFADPAVVAAAEADPDGAAGTALDRVLAQHSSWLGFGLTLAGLAIALLAPVLGARADDKGRRRTLLGVYTAITVVISGAMFFVTPDPASLEQNLLLGIFLLAVGNIFFELASVNYNATLAQVSTPRDVGRVSGIGWGAGYLGGIVLLLILFVGFINPEVGWFGVSDENGLDIRAAVLVSAVWFAVFALPVLVVVPEVPPSPARARLGLVGSYRQLFRDVRGLWRERRSTLWFLLASAVYRDGLAGVFTFGAVIASGTFGFTAEGVIVFAIAANVVAGLATILGGWLDDRVGPKAIIVTSLTGLLVAGAVVFALHDGGQTVFWIFGLLLCLFVGPAQSSSRTLLARLIPAGRESEIFGLYATTGRAASFLAPLGFSTFIAVSGSQHWGILGILLVVAAGLALLVPIRAGRPQDAEVAVGAGSAA
ncbi:MFS transporter [Actinotalea ferrariae]|uniref:MFS transporter n=1 Tax=Actinotalea ferrariae TaxID=1386098 RepID=UPI001C8B9DBD|nr:MFS transporter [Actinotalea ferrariae]MBX9246794.1 MFS transporter [Actinotalea ferrariae]